MNEKIYTNSWFIALVIITLGVLVRLYGITLPLVDALQIKQAHMAMIARNLYLDGMNIFCTRLDHFDGCFLLEFPIMQSLTALLYYLFDVNEMLGRLVNVVFSVGGMLAMYGLARMFLSRTVALAALALFVFSPTNIYVSRAFMVEPSMLFFSITAVYLFLKWQQNNALWSYVLSAICTALACLAKPYAGIILAPIFTAWFLKRRWGLLRRFDFWLYVVIAIMPVMLWAMHANYVNMQNPNIPVGHGGNWLVVLLGRGNPLVHLSSPGFYVNMGKWVALSLLTPIGFIGMIAGCFFVPSGDARRILFAWLGAVMAFIVVFAGANRFHPYYQLQLLPVAVLLFGYAVGKVLEYKGSLTSVVKARYGWVLVTFVIAVTTSAYGIGYYKYFSYMYDIKLRMPYAIEVSEILKENTPEGSAFLLNQPGAIPAVISYYSQRRSRGFGVISDKGGIKELEHQRSLAATGDEDAIKRMEYYRSHGAVAAGDDAIEGLEYQRSQGAAAYVAVDTKYGSGVEHTKSAKRFWAYLQERYTPIAVSEHYIIFDLTKPKISNLSLVSTLKN